MSSFRLIKDEQGCALVDTTTRQHPLRIDFSSAKPAWRRTRKSRRQELLARATGAAQDLHVLDCTAGLGRDSFILASFGCTVTLIERSPALAGLLQDALERAADSNVSDIVNRMTLVEGDAIDFLQQLERVPDVIYLDPMFPSRRKHAKVKGDMQMLQRFLGPDPDTQTLIDTALATTCRRVVLKRPAHGAAMAEPEPAFTLKGKTRRFDVFINREHNERAVL